MVKPPNPDAARHYDRYVSELVSKYLTQKLLAFVSEMQQFDKGADAFPRELAMHARRPLTNPSLEFIKATCHVLALDKNVHAEVARVRRVLLTQIGVREFGSEARFDDPSDSFVLPDVICSSCHACRDLDLCRDAIATDGDGGGGGGELAIDDSHNGHNTAPHGAGAHHRRNNNVDGAMAAGERTATAAGVRLRWQCEQCEAPYDAGAIELELIELVQVTCF